MTHPGSSSLIAIVSTAAALAACAQPCDPAAHSLRVVVQTQAEWSDLAAVGAKVSQIAGQPVRDLSASSTRLFAATLVCADARACDAGLQRLAEARDFAVEARADVRRTIPRPITPSSSAAR